MTTRDQDRYEEELTQEQLELRSYEQLIDRYGENEEIRSALAVAWRMGFSRALRMHGHGDTRLTINPFWL